jgi:hypothetical protein
MPKSYVEVPFPLDFVRRAMIDTQPTIDLDPALPLAYDQDLINALLPVTTRDHGLDLMGRVVFGFNDNKKISGDYNTPADLYKIVVATAKKKGLVLTEDEVTAVYAFVYSTQSMYSYWFQLLNQPISSNSQALLQVDLKRVNNELVVSYQEREKQIKDYSEKATLSSTLNTLVKAKLSGVIKLLGVINESNNQQYYTFVPDAKDKETRLLSIIPALWDTHLLPAARHQVKQEGVLGPQDLYALIPFLLNPGFRSEFNTRLGQQQPEVRQLAAAYINLCFAQHPELNRIVSAIHAAQIISAPVIKVVKPVDANGEGAAPPLSPSSTSSTSASVSPLPPGANANHVNEGVASATHSRSGSTSGTGYSSLSRTGSRRASVSTSQPSLQQHEQQPQPQPRFHPTPLTPDQEFQQEFDKLKNLNTQMSYEAMQKQSVEKLCYEIGKLTGPEVDKHKPMLTQLIRHSRLLIETPMDDANLSACVNLIQPLRNASLLHLTLAFVAMITGAALIAVCTAVAVASFGATTLLSSWGITVGTTMLTKGLAIAGAAVGLSLLTGGLYFSTHQPLKQIIYAANSITNNATKFWRSPKGEGAKQLADNPLPPSPRLSRHQQPT